MKKIFSAILMLSTIPAFATGVSSTETTADCDKPTLNTYTGTSNLQADWRANTIALHWYSDGEELNNIPTASQSCVYDSTLTPPPAPTKTGYTFKGWRVKQAAGCSFASQVCGLNGSAVNGLTYNMDDSTAYGWYSHDGRFKGNESTYGLTAGGWAIKDTSGGIVKGIASCNSTKANVWDTVMEETDNGTMTEEQFVNTLWGTCNTDTFRPSNTFSSSSTGQNCWCKMESYTPSGGSACNVSSSSWVFYESDIYDDADRCAESCAYNCATSVQYYDVHRRALFGVQ